MELNEIKTIDDAVQYVIETADPREDRGAIIMCLGIAATFTYVMYYTDAPEALAASLGDLPGAVLESGGEYIPTT